MRKSIAEVGAKMATIGYARVSTNGQDYNGQIDELKAAGCHRIFREKVSGAKSDRVQLAKLMRALKKGDVLIVTRLDRLARSTLDLLSILRRVTDAGAEISRPHRACRRQRWQTLISLVADARTQEPHGSF